MDKRFLFRGKRVDNGKWWVGHCFEGAIGTYIATGAPDDSVYMIEVDTSTIGQCTGLTAAKSYREDDEDERLIWEGDIVRKRLGKDRHYDAGIVWIAAGFERRGVHGFHPIHGLELEIIGNIHDHPELLDREE